QDIVAARAAARDLARGLGFAAMDQSRIATPGSEIARNVIRYAHEAGGSVDIHPVDRDSSTGIEIVVRDTGPGIPDIELAMRPGTATGRALGLGRPAARRLMHARELGSSPQGTTVLPRGRRR